MENSIKNTTHVKSSHIEPYEYHSSDLQNRREVDASEKIKKIYRLFVSRIKMLNFNLVHMMGTLDSPETETLLQNTLKKEWAILDYKFGPSYSLKCLLRQLYHRILKKTYVISKEEGAPKISIALKEGNQLPSLNFISTTETPNFNSDSLGRPVKDKEEADLFVKSLFKMKEIPWEYKFTGCDTKLALSSQILEYMGISRSSLKKIWAAGKGGTFLRWESSDSIPSHMKHWKWHVALLVETNEKNKYVIDPSVNPTQSLAIDEWKKHLGPKGCVTTEEMPLSFIPLRGKTVPFSRNNPAYSFELSRRDSTSEKERVKCEEIATRVFNERGFLEMYCYRLLCSVPYTSKTRKDLSQILCPAGENRLDPEAYGSTL